MEISVDMKTISTSCFPATGQNLTPSPAAHLPEVMGLSEKRQVWWLSNRHLCSLLQKSYKHVLTPERAKLSGCDCVAQNQGSHKPDKSSENQVYVTAGAIRASVAHIHLKMESFIGQRKSHNLSFLSTKHAGVSAAE